MERTYYFVLLPFPKVSSPVCARFCGSCVPFKEQSGIAFWILLGMENHAFTLSWLLVESVSFMTVSLKHSNTIYLGWDLLKN